MELYHKGRRRKYYSRRAYFGSGKLFTLLIIVLTLVVAMIFIFKGIKVFKERPSMTCLVIGGLQFMIYRAPRMNRILF